MNKEIKWLYNIGDKNQNLTITERKIVYKKRINTKTNKEYMRKCKYYKYKCNKCGFDCEEHYKNQELREELWILEYDLIRNSGCSCCANQIVVEGINDIPTTAPEIVKYFQGGYDEAKLYNKTSSKSIYPICPDCGRVKNNNIHINGIYSNKTIGCNCNDKIPYGEKMMANILEKTNINYIQQLSQANYRWCSKYKYDFYIPSLNIIIEVNGLQHYEETTGSWRMTLEEIQKNDEYKKQLAIANGIKEENYITIDCRYSKLEWCKDNILNSRLSELFDLSSIDWDIANEFAISNFKKEICDYYKIYNDLSTYDISTHFNISVDSVRKYLNEGTIIGWCYYNGKDQLRKGVKKTHSKCNKPVEIFKDGRSLGIFPSATELERQSEKLFGVKLNNASINLVCREKQPKYKGFTFKQVIKI